MTGRIPVGISSCLLGARVRFDGGHKRDRFLSDELAQYFDWVMLCPEVAAGLGVPRETFHLQRDRERGRISMVGNRTGSDVTARVSSAAEELARRLKDGKLRGFVLKKGSPTCGLERVRIYDHNHVPTAAGTGLFAQALSGHLPHLPLEEEGRLKDPRIRENFVTRVFTYDRWLTLREGDPRPADVVAFHAAHKMLLLAHSPQGASSLGRLVSQAGILPLRRLLDGYESGLMTALAHIASPRRHVNVLEHLAGFLKRQVSAEDKRELRRTIQDYRLGRATLLVPLVLLRHHFRSVNSEWLHRQVYLNPHPSELALRRAI